MQSIAFGLCLLVSTSFANAQTGTISQNQQASANLARMQNSLGGLEEPLESVVRKHTKDPVAPGLSVVGSGFFISDQGHFVTNAHTVVGCRNLTAEHPAFGEIGATLIGVNTRIDTAVLKSDIAGLTKLALAQGQADTAVIIASSPVVGPFDNASEWRSGRLVSPGAKTVGGRLAQISASLEPGESGGAVIDESGQAIAMVIGRLRNTPTIGAAVSGGAIADFLDYLGVRPDSSRSGLAGQIGDIILSRPTMTPDDVFRTSANAVVRVRCRY